MTMLTLMISLAMFAGAFVISYVASRICFAVKKKEDMLWAAMLCICGLFYPAVFAGVYADANMAPSVVPFVAVFTLLASLGAHLLALRKLK